MRQTKLIIFFEQRTKDVVCGLMPGIELLLPQILKPFVCLLGCFTDVFYQSVSALKIVRSDKVRIAVMNAIAVIQFTLHDTKRIQFCLEGIRKIRAKTDGVVLFKGINHRLRKLKVIELDLN